MPTEFVLFSLSSYLRLSLNLCPPKAAGEKSIEKRQRQNNATSFIVVIIVVDSWLFIILLVNNSKLSDRLRGRSVLKMRQSEIYLFELLLKWADPRR